MPQLECRRAKTGIEPPPSTSQSESEATQGPWTGVEEAKNETFVIPTSSPPWGLTLGFHKNRNVEILKADTVKGISNGKLGLLRIVENNILVGRDGQKDKKCSVPSNSNTFGRRSLSIVNLSSQQFLQRLFLFNSSASVKAQHDDCPQMGRGCQRKERRVNTDNRRSKWKTTT